MELTYYLQLLRRRLLVVLLCGVLGAAAAYGAVALRTPEYRATTTIFVSMSRGDSVSGLVQGSTYTRNLVQSYVRLATTPTVLDPVVEQLGLDTSAGALAGSITAEADLDTAMLDITVAGPSPEQAARIANAVGAQVTREALALAPQTGDDPDLISVTTVAEALPPGSPSGPDPRLVAIAGLLAGLGGAVVVLVGRELLSTRLRTGADVAEVTDTPVLAGIPATRAGRGRGRRAEGLRTLRTHLRLLTATVDHPVVTITLAGEPARTRRGGRDSAGVIALDLARTMADAETRVLLVEGDLRRPVLAQALRISAGPGLADVLAGRAGLETTITGAGQAGVDVLVAGDSPTDPVGLLGTTAARRLLHELAARYDVVLLTAPPLGPVVDAAALGAAGDGVVVLVDTRSTTRDALGGALASLQLARARVLGTVLTGLPPGAPGATTWAGAGEPEEPAVIQVDETAPVSSLAGQVTPVR